MSGRRGGSRGTPRRPGVPLPWDPLRDLLGLKERVNRLLEALLRRGDSSELPIAAWSPPVDLVEQRDAYILTAEIPGMGRDDLVVKVERGLVILEGRRHQEWRASAAQRIERPYGSFARTIHLGGPVDEARVRARLHLGVLEIVLPKSSGARSHPIRVQVQS